MGKFKTDDFDIKAGSLGSEVRVVKYESDFAPKVEPFTPARIHGPTESEYGSGRRKGASSASKKGGDRKDQRFALSPLLRDALSIEEEEQRAIEARVQARVRELSEQARAEGREAGHQEGLRKGREEAMARFREEMAPQVDRIQSLFAELDRAKGEIFSANERFLIELVYRVGRTVLLRELATDRDFLMRLTRELVERVGVRENVRIRIAAEDAQLIGRIRENLEKSLGNMKNLNVETSNEIRRGGCKIETDWNAIDATIEQQLQGVYEGLIGGAGSASGGSGPVAPASGEPAA